MATRKQNRPGKGIPFGDVLARDLKDPAARAAFATRRLIHEIALHVRSMREAAHLTQAELAERVGTKQPAIARLERSEQHAPQWELLARIATALGRQLRLVFDEPDDEAPLVRVPRRRRAGAAPAAQVARCCLSRDQHQ